MASPILIAYFLWQIRSPQTTVPRPATRSVYEQTVLPQGDLTVTEESPDGGTIPPGATRVPMLRLRLTASCAADVHVNGVNAIRKGAGAASDVEGVYLLHRGVRVSDSRTVNRNGSVHFALRDLVVPSCETEDVLLFADFSADASPAGEHRFELAAEGVTTDNAPVRIDHRRGKYILQTAGRAVGQVAVNFLRLTETVRFGNRQTVSRFTLTADNRDDQLIEAITFTNDGSASGENLQNFFVEMRGRTVSETTQAMTGKTVRLTFDPPLVVRKSQTLSFRLKADVRVGYSRSIGFTVEEAADVEARPLIGR